MIDAHVHIEKGPYSKDWIWQFISKACERGITQLHLLEHSHRFREFYDMYKEAMDHPVCGPYQKQWIQARCIHDLENYKALVTDLRNEPLPIKVKWGLEICYFPGTEDILQRIVSDFDWDFLTGSVHWLNGWGFDHPKNKYSWESLSVDRVYEEYYQQMIQLVNTRLFSILAHPDSIKCFGYYPSNPPLDLYTVLAKSLVRNKVKAEFSAGLKNNYDHKEIGLNSSLLAVFLDHGVELITASDAHDPDKVGLNIKEAKDILYTHREGGTQVSTHGL